tara:strand:- start:334 stop:822 length:489 start_codon:yes stop_codon:yes gene_type:complete
MTEELKKIIFSPQISNIFHKNDWIINKNTKNKYHSYFVGEIADYFLTIFSNKDKIYFQFTLNIEIPNRKVNELLILMNFANQNSEEGFFVFDFKINKIKYNLILSDTLIIEERAVQDFIKIKLYLTRNLFHNFVSGVHNLLYGEKIEIASLKLLFLKNVGCA